MPANKSTAFTDSNVPGANRDTVTPAHSPYARLYAEVLSDLDSPFAQFLKKLHGVSDTVKIGHALGLGGYSVATEADATEALQMLARDDQYPRFKDNWARALTYRYRPLEAATPTNRADNTVKEIIQQAEQWIDALFDAMCNVTGVNNKPNSIELKLFQSADLDKKAVEAACRSILISLIHRYVVGFAGLRTNSIPTREDRKLTCKQRLLTIIDALKHDKRICKDALTEDSKVAFFVHAPLAVTKCKKNQERGNDVKRDLLAEAAAARRKAGVPSTTPIIIEGHGETGSTSSSPAPVIDRDLPALQGPGPAMLDFQTTCKSTDHNVNTITHDMEVSVLSSEGFAALNQEHASKKRSHVKVEDEDDIVSKKAKVATKQ